MNPKIFKLSSHVINQIAAGEVVEHPGSIVKELVENSLDAHAKEISIEIVAGGQQLIRIEDDGCGMSQEDAILSLERHATSKIQTLEDLEKLSTLGFRGEALAAISSVSHFEMKTSNGVGTRIVAEGGEIKCIEPCARNKGTTIEIRSLFYNVPARKKFQKSPSANAAAVTRILETMALAYPDVAFSWNGRNLPPGSFEQRIEQILGKHEHLIQTEDIFGFAACVERASSNRAGQYVYINQRPIFSPLIAKAVKEAFGTRIAEHSYPRFVLFLKISPDLVDVNVHPQKKEVRFRDERAIFQAVLKAVENSFSSQISFSKSLLFSSPSSFSPPLESSFTFQEALFEKAAELPIFIPEKPLVILGPYLLLQKEKLFLVDLKAVRARIFFEEIQEKSFVVQPLLWPLEMSLEKGEEEKIEELSSFGIEYRLIKNFLFIDALPSILEESDFPLFFKEWKGGKKIEQIAVQLSRARKSTFTVEEAMALWQRLQKCKDQIYDPLGHRISVELQEEDLAKLIGKANYG